VTDRWNDASPEAQHLASEYYEIDLAEMLVAAQAAIARVRALTDGWAHTGQDPNACIDMDNAAEAIRDAVAAPVSGPAPTDDYEQTTGHAITCTAGFTNTCDCTKSDPTVPGAPLPSIHANDVAGFCPACTHPTLQVGDGGHLVCVLMDCPKPEAADALLHGAPACGAPGPWGDAHTCWLAADHRSDHEAHDGCGWIEDQETAKDPESFTVRSTPADTPSRRTGLREQIYDVLNEEGEFMGCPTATTNVIMQLIADTEQPALAWTPPPPGSTREHVYLSTGCWHGDHDYCQSMTGLNGAKRPAECKKCRAKCICGCHTDQPKEQR
jgi:hypothetical protein